MRVGHCAQDAFFLLLDVGTMNAKALIAFDCVRRILSGIVQIAVTTSLSRDGIKDAIRTVVVID